MLRFICLVVSVSQKHHEFKPIPGMDSTMRIDKNGTGDRVVEEGDVVVLHVKALVRHHGRSFGKWFWDTTDDKQGGPITFEVGSDNKLPKGIDGGCRGMKLGETRELQVPWHEVGMAWHGVT